MMKSDEKAILVEKEGSNDPSFVINYTPRNEVKELSVNGHLSSREYNR